MEVMVEREVGEPGFVCWGGKERGDILGEERVLVRGMLGTKEVGIVRGRRGGVEERVEGRGAETGGVGVGVWVGLGVGGESFWIFSFGCGGGVARTIFCIGRRVEGVEGVEGIEGVKGVEGVDGMNAAFVGGRGVKGVLGVVGDAGAEGEGEEGEEEEGEEGDVEGGG